MPLLDQAAVIAAMAYVDLNQIRAGTADRPEASDYTSAQDRCIARQEHRAAQLVPALSATATTPESGLWIAPIVRATIDQPDGCAFTAAITLSSGAEGLGYDHVQLRGPSEMKSRCKVL